MKSKLLTTLRCVLLAAALPLALNAPACGAGLESKLERGLGRQIAKALEEEAGVVNDPFLMPWVVGIGERLAAVSGRTDVTYTFKILDSEEINALAVPGGYVYVTKGLLRFIDSEDELAGVLGHEIGHIGAKHSNRQIKAQILGSLVLSSLKNERLERMVGGARLAGLFALLKFSRDHELEADELGLASSSALGYDGREMLAFFRRMQDRQKEKPSRLESYFLTHPTFQDRVQRIAARPEFEETADNRYRHALNLRERSLPAQSRLMFQAALAADPNLTGAARALAEGVGEEMEFDPVKPVRLERVKGFDAAFAEAVESLEARFVDMDRRQAGLEKQVRGIFSNLRFASRFVSDYDLVRIREFMTALDAAEGVARIVAGLGLTRASAGSTLKELSELREKLADEGSPPELAARYEKEALATVGALGVALDSASEVAGSAQRAGRTVDFAVHQLTTSLMMPSPTALGMSGMIELQLAGVRKTIAAGRANARKLAGDVERQRSVALEMRIDLQTANLDARQAFACTGLIARYFGVSAEEVAAARQTRRFGGAALAVARQVSEAGSAEAETEKSPSGSGAAPGGLNYDGVNIMLEMISRDIEREMAAASQLTDVQAR